MINERGRGGKEGREGRRRRGKYPLEHNKPHPVLSRI